MVGFAPRVRTGLRITFEGYKRVPGFAPESTWRKVTTPSYRHHLGFTADGVGPRTITGRTYVGPVGFAS